MLYSYDDIEGFNGDDFEVGDVICGYIFFGGYTKAKVEFAINKKYEVELHTKDDYKTLSNCWGIDKKSVKELLDYANEATDSVSTIIELVTSTELYCFVAFDEWLADYEGIDIADLNEDEIEIKIMELEEQSVTYVYSDKEILYMVRR